MSNTQSSKKKKRNDILLIIILLVFGAASWLVMNIMKDDGGQVVVTVDGEETARYELDQDQSVRLESEGGYNVLVIQNGEAFVTEADCRDGLCIKQGKISKGGENLVCLPHRTVITIEGVKATNIDGGAQ